ncbi:hypothetical protein DZK27_14060 [Rhodobacteraceae bacterium 63075]|nr:hypothetical protein DZK27_14060 [Rhodobacteraceae bacterium 63075]
MIRPLTLVFGTLCLVFALASCGNQPGRGLVMKSITSGALKKNQAPANADMPSQQELEANISHALANSDKRLSIVVIEKRDSFSFLTEISQNGPIRTWASPDRRTLSTSSGLIVATRGLGFDLMSASLPGSKALVTSRKAGQAQRVLRYLDGENQKQELRFSCRVSRGKPQKIAIGEIRASTITMTESCRSSGASFENTYLVDGRGRIVQSRQWLGAENSYIFWQKLRH